MEETLFTKILAGTIPSEIIYQDDICFAVRDINPQAPVHVLLIPCKVIPQLSKQTEEDQNILGHLLTVVPKIASQEGVGGKYRLVINDGAEAGQTVFHLHLHILGGRNLTWPPG